jgi:hypothetical protein
MPTCSHQGQTLALTQISDTEWKVRLRRWDDYNNALAIAPGTVLVTEDQTLIVQVFTPARRSGAMVRTGTITTYGCYLRR